MGIPRRLMQGIRSFRPTDNRLYLVFFPVWLACAFAVALLVTVLDHGNQELYSRLEKHGVVVMAAVTRTEPTNHNTVFYSFVVRGTTYSSADNSWPPNPEASKLSVGERVYVVYDARDPNVSCACDPHQAAVPSQWWRVFIIGLFGGSVVAVLITLRILRRFGASAATA